MTEKFIPEIMVIGVDSLGNVVNDMEKSDLAEVEFLLLVQRLKTWKNLQLL